MKLLLDLHLSRKLVPMLEVLYPGTTQVALVSLPNRDDQSVWDFARDGGYAIVTKDEDFHVLSFARGHPPKVIWLRSGNGPTRHVFDILSRAREIIERFGEDESRSLLILP